LQHTAKKPQKANSKEAKSNTSHESHESHESHKSQETRLEKKKHHITYVTTRADPSLSELDVLQVQLPDFEGGRPVPAVQSRSSAVEWSHRNMQKWKLMVNIIMVYYEITIGNMFIMVSP